MPCSGDCDLRCISCGRSIDQMDIVGPYCYACIVAGSIGFDNSSVMLLRVARSFDERR